MQNPTDDLEARAVTLGKYIAENVCTVRAVANVFSLGKSTVHKDVTERLAKIDPELFESVRRILDYNLSVRHIRGGEATRIKSIVAKADSAPKE